VILSSCIADRNTFLLKIAAAEREISLEKLGIPQLFHVLREQVLTMRLSVVPADTRAWLRKMRRVFSRATFNAREI